MKNLPNSYFIGHLVNKLILDHKLKGEKCEECDEDDPAFVYCTECNYSFVVIARSLTSTVKSPHSQFDIIDRNEE